MHELSISAPRNKAAHKQIRAAVFSERDDATGISSFGSTAALCVALSADAVLVLQACLQLRLWREVQKYERVERTARRTLVRKASKACIVITPLKMCSSF
ncbi:transcription factor FapR domain protein [Umbribacter vaginalis]|nr:transcription factor FapR domain protein [Coriobacteriales bacterium DNF00809]